MWNYSDLHYLEVCAEVSQKEEGYEAEVIDLSDRVSGSLFRSDGEWGCGVGWWEGSEGPKLLFQDREGQKTASRRATAGQNVSQHGGMAQT